MAQLRFKGFASGTAIDLADVTVGTKSGGLNVPAFRAPGMARTLPCLNTTQTAGDTLGMDISGLSGVTAQRWRAVGGAVLASTPDFDSTGHGGTWVQPEVDTAAGPLTGPAVHIYMTMPMASHNADDAAIVAIVPHHDATHIAISDGNWSDPTIWLNGRVPANGARVLVPHGRSLRYDTTQRHIRLDWVRVDGTLNWATDITTHMLVETIIGTRGSTITIGSGPNDRVEAGVEAGITWSARDYRSGDFFPRDIALARDPKLWGRGFVHQGTLRVWGREKFHGGLATQGVDQGATSLTLEHDPTGWEIGDRVVISGMRIHKDALPNQPYVHEDEERTITAITGRMITWDAPLLYSHGDETVFGAGHEDQRRADIRPIVQLLEGRNVTFRSEYTGTDKPWLRGHGASVHGMSTVDLWGVQCLDMGRADKSRPVGVDLGTGQFRAHDNTSRQDVALDARSNVQGRYAWHLHHVGFDHATLGRPRPVVAQCYFARTPGWCLVHHSCDADLFQNSIREIWSGGIIGEQGDEIGLWADNIVSHTTAFNQGTSSFGHMVNTGKPDKQESAGDHTRRGYLYGYRGRTIRTIGNLGFNAYWGHVFNHRTGVHSERLADMRRSHRSRLDLSSIAEFTHPITQPFDEVSTATYPIIHFNDNTTVAVFGGFFVTKPVAQQTHDVSIKLRHNRVWGALGYGAFIEYVVTYIIDNWDVSIARTNHNGASAFRTSTNAFQIVFRNCLSQGSWLSNGISLHAGSVGGLSDVYEPGNPRFVDVANDTGITQYAGPGNQTLSEVRYHDDDFGNVSVAYDSDPTVSFPDIAGVWDGNSTNLSTMTNADGLKVTNMGALGKVAPKVFNDNMFPEAGGHGIILRQVCTHRGYYQHSGGDVLLQRSYFSDDITGRPTLKAYLWEISDGWSKLGTDNGPLDHVTTPITATDTRASVAPGGSVTLDLVTGATGGNGTIVIDARDYLAPDRGHFVNNGDGTITYTPDGMWENVVDEFYVFLRSGDTMFKTVRVNILIGADLDPDIPLAATHFTATGGTGALAIALQQTPATYGRHIRLVMYSTDDGATWRRLSNHWPQKVHHVTLASDGTALSAGSHTVRIRYEHDHEYAYATSAGVPVTVT